MGAREKLTGDQLAAISNELIRLKAEYYGKGAVEAKCYQNDDFIFCTLKGGMTRVEETLYRTGDQELIRQVRLRFQDQLANEFQRAVEKITERQVINYQSAVVFDPMYTFEIFLLAPPNDDVSGPGTPP